MKQTLRSRWQALVIREYTIPEASALFMIAFLVSAALGIVRQVLFNAQFGAGMEANAFYAAFRLPDTLTALIAGGTLSNALIPVLAGVAREEGQAAEWQLASLVLTIFLLVFTLAVLIGVLFAPLFVTHVLAPGFDQPTSDLTIILTRIMLFQSILSVATSVIMAVLNGRHQFTLSGLTIITHNTTLIAGILAARFIPGLGIYGPALGVIGDALVQLCILLPGLRPNQFRYRPAWNLADRRLRHVVRLLLPNGLSAVVNYTGSIVDTAYASFAPETAALPAIQNALLLIGLPTRLLGVAVAQAAFPRMASQVAAAQWARMRSTIMRTLSIAVVLALPVMVAMVGLGRSLIRLLFERGRFDATAGSLTYAMLVAYIVALPAYIATELISRSLIAMRDTTTPLITNCGQLALRVGLVALLLQRIGAVAIPVAFAISSVIEAIALMGVLLLKLRRPPADLSGLSHP
jgi:putative peptidoglycan lipid II flippase